MAKPLRGYSRLPGSSRQYRTPQGRTISRYEYDSIRARRAGWKNRGEVERFRESYAGSLWHRKLQESDADASYSGQGMRSARDVERQRESGRYTGQDAGGHRIKEDRSPDGALAQLLVALGYRDESDSWDVGDSPSGNDPRP